MLTLVITGLLIAAGWAVSLYLWPFAPCRKCEGTGRNPGSSRKRHGECRRCQGKGRRIRTGAATIHRGRVALADRTRRKAGRK
ncbi:hypothetical protein [Trebonia sp.]|uniref:hypothetical protein n=1 Tax=Trebonia sp. TaxID=2767075 RepID=UPI00262B9269|nr:hypothetical protein [Trebonia sp.]